MRPPGANSIRLGVTLVAALATVGCAHGRSPAVIVPVRTAVRREPVIAPAPRVAPAEPAALDAVAARAIVAAAMRGRGEFTIVALRSGALECRTVHLVGRNPRAGPSGTMLPIWDVDAHVSIDAYLEEEGAMTLRRPVLRGRTFAGLEVEMPACEERYEIRDGPADRVRFDRGTWFLTRAACERDLQDPSSRAFDLGTCVDGLERAVARVRAHSPATPVRDRLAEILDRGGHVYEPDTEEGHSGECRDWHVRAASGQVFASAMVMQAEWREGRLRHTRQYGIDGYDGLRITLSGPEGASYRGRQRLGGGHAYCGHHLYVDPHEEWIDVGSVRWYFTRRACDAAVRAPIDGVPMTAAQRLLRRLPC